MWRPLEALFPVERTSVSYNDNQLTGYRARNVAVVFQFYNLIPTLTAYENVALMRDIVNDTMGLEGSIGVCRTWRPYASVPGADVRW